MSMTVPTPTIDELRARGAWNAALDSFAESDPDWTERCACMSNNPWTTGVLPVKWIELNELDPQWLEQFIAMGADLYRGVLPAKLVELIAIAADASCTHLYSPGIRRHMQGALAQGATIEEIMEVLKLCGAQGVDACELGAPILYEELTNYQDK